MALPRHPGLAVACCACAVAFVGCESSNSDRNGAERAGFYRPDPKPVVARELPPVVEDVTDGYMAVELRRDTALFSGPESNRRKAVVDDKSVFLRSTMWLPVLDSADNGMVQVDVPWVEGTRVAWLDPTGLERHHNEFMIIVSMRRSRLYVVHDDEIAKVSTVTLGDDESPTPRGTFAITDRVTVPASLVGAYGDRALGLSVLQDQLPAGWSGGNQVAIHGGPDAPELAPRGATAGCIVVDDETLAWLWKRTPPGTLVVVQS
jgi:hypothetical protein